MKSSKCLNPLKKFAIRVKTKRKDVRRDQIKTVLNDEHEYIREISLTLTPTLTILYSSSTYSLVNYVSTSLAK